MLDVATTGPPFCGTAVAVVLKEFKEEDEPAYAVVPDSWLVLGAWLMLLFCLRPALGGVDLEGWMPDEVCCRMGGISTGAFAIAFDCSQLRESAQRRLSLYEDQRGYAVSSVYLSIGASKSRSRVLKRSERSR